MSGYSPVLSLADVAADLDTVGGKGASLARLVGAGIPVPTGFHVTTHAYRDFVARDGLREHILATVAETDATDQDSLDKAAASIAEAVAGREIPATITTAIRDAYQRLSGDAESVAVAVRSSATAEDLPDMSFAGQQDSFLNINGADALLDAVKRCWASLWTARAIGYRARYGIAPEDVALAVVVQRLIPAEAAGVLFTANPLNGARNELMINAAWGLGESVVGGQVTPDTYIVARRTGAEPGDELRREINDKAVQTVREAGGTRECPVPEERRRAAVLDTALTRELAALGERIDEQYGMPMDIEWTLHEGQLSIVQARPITNLADERVEPAVWNDTLAGDYLWTSGNVSEAVPSVMTPATWSAVRVIAPQPVADLPLAGNIGGRYYLNLSTTIAIGSALGMGKIARRAAKQIFGRVPDGVGMPSPRISPRTALRGVLDLGLPALRMGINYRRRLPVLLAETPRRCRAAHRRISEATEPAELVSLWHAEVSDLLYNTCTTLDQGARQAALGKTWTTLCDLVGEADANALLTGLHSEQDELASLGPVLGLARVRSGELSAADYAAEWGHRCANEFELFEPRPAEDPSWLARQAAGGAEPTELLRRQSVERAQAWQRLRQRHPSKVKGIERTLRRVADNARARERARSEMVRVFWVLRAFVLRAGELTELGDDLFFLPLDEILAVLGGSREPLAAVPAQRAAYARYSALPPYPTAIRGRFDPVAWAADPLRRADFYDAEHQTGTAAPAEDAAINGFAGAAGVVEGVARVVASVTEGEQLQPGEILVTTLTNVGWTPLFPRVAAVVTDVGAPLSHAAIVARELGVPAVVGCGNATTRISTGDQIRVDGGKGTVTILGAP
ncbi:pyruvate,water dikinase [Tamaricihabitans halophyticus]|uniref:Pyruvate,water dikinase n=1 Tax=Tamaricihabitans halophyticus TaxID=1262583 RepID=A0A4R2R9T1_9PSEU|nr:PEP/pyruvate-binding domain-containing protein [Tamaricihabitans halophyticus]TCP56165.1 pyruvate,water dikinase [Tamaricihabitans halophyticus]